MKLIEVVNVSKSFKGIQIFNQANAVFEQGNIYGILGPNGSGKSVLFKLICGFIKPDQGDIIIHPSYRSRRADFPQNFGIIIDRPGYAAGLTGFENLKRWAEIRNQIKDEDIKRTMRVVGLDPDARQKMKSYSLGMKQKIAFAQAIMENQQVLILDEPFNAMDVDSVKVLRELLIKYKQEGRTIILTSHNEEDIELLCDQVYQIRSHKLVPVNTMAKV
ncbi:MULTISPECIES: ATP-binding cassette domain-containing protein [Paenibacillus]|uniref:Multidrug ABC transporter ATP-binding protein n=1 Tax=Paenibacillus campinasensis TaxID=66347 RepID=A0A268EMQ9_9BACL|nr:MULTISPECIES: ATP-binding cassette domain-containing protein [Paenibacillus]PAD74409.1 multidrug ABC transporter ATP-binding protein [Paenibacillus campinasensis]PAK50806.1 multidrug ABC transporter ATP-binding protein [Paenibacillus sp. 7541]